MKPLKLYVPTLKIFVKNSNKNVQMIVVPMDFVILENNVFVNIFTKVQLVQKNKVVIIMILKFAQLYKKFQLILLLEVHYHIVYTYLLGFKLVCILYFLNYDF